MEKLTINATELKYKTCACTKSLRHKTRFIITKWNRPTQEM